MPRNEPPIAASLPFSMMSAGGCLQGLSQGSSGRPQVPVMQSSAPQQSSPLAVAQGAPVSPQQTCPSEVSPQTKPSQHSSCSSQGVIGALHMSPPPPSPPDVAVDALVTVVLCTAP